MMCTVQVLLLPEVVVRREQPLTARNICRRLFAPADDAGVSEQRAQFLTAVQEDLEKRNRDRWNFDFRTETPLPGRYQWVPLCTSAAQPRDSTVNEVPRAYGQRPSSASPRQTNKVSRTQPKTTTQSKITGEWAFYHDCDIID